MLASDGSELVPVARVALVLGSQRGRQHVPMRRGAQHAPSQSHGQLLTSRLEGHAVQHSHGILVCDVGIAQDNAQAPFLDSLQPGSLLGSET